jgi:hypothetical protein
MKYALSATLAFALFASTAAQAQLQMAANFVSPPFEATSYSDSDVNSLRSIALSSGRVYAGLGTELRWFMAGASRWNISSLRVKAPDIECERFAQTMASDGSSIVVGSESGHVYFFETQSTPPVLVASWRAPQGQAAQALRLIGDTALIGLPSRNDNAPVGSPSGGVLLRRLGSTVQVAAAFSGSSVAPEIGRCGDFNESFVVLSGERPSWFREAHTMTWQRQGDSWAYRGEPNPSNPVGLAIFGRPSVIDGNVLAVGARDDDQAGWQSGACFIFRWNGTSWQQEAKVVLAQAPFSQQEFGEQLAIHDGKVYVSAPGYIGTGSGDRGRVFVISNRTGGTGGWAVEQELRPPDTGLSTAWGIGPKFSPNGAMFFMGADSPAPYTAWRNIITAYGPPTDCNENGVQDAREVLESPGIDLNEDGVPDSCQCATNPSLPTCCPGDLDHDSTVGGADIGLLLSNWGPCGSACLYDLNNDDKVNGGDLGLLLAGWGPCSD